MAAVQPEPVAAAKQTPAAQHEPASQPKPVAAEEPKPTATAEPKPAAAEKPKPAAVAKPKPAASASDIDIEKYADGEEREVARILKQLVNDKFDEFDTDGNNKLDAREFATLARVEL